MRTLPDHLLFRSEQLEPMFVHCVGRWFAQSQYMKETYGPHSAAYVDSLQEWWWGMEKLSSLLIVCQGAVHAQVAHGNEMQAVKAAIERELGIKFSFTDKQLNFRALVPFDLTFPQEVPV